MQDPCDPPPHHVHTVTHHHPTAHVIGRIRRHGTLRIANRLHAVPGGCPAGPPLVVGGATLKAIIPAVAFAGLTTLASSVTMPAGPQADEGFAAAGGFGLGGGGYGVGGTTGVVSVPPHQHGHHPRPPVSVAEPPSFILLLLAIVGWMCIRSGFRRGRA